MVTFIAFKIKSDRCEMYEKSHSASNFNSFADNECNDQESYTSGNCMLEKKRGFKPSDRHNPNKKQFLIELSKQIWRKSDVS